MCKGTSLVVFFLMKAQCSSRKTDRKSLREIRVKAYAGPLQTAFLDEIALVLVENAEMLLFCLHYELQLSDSWTELQVR